MKKGLYLNVRIVDIVILKWGELMRNDDVDLMDKIMLYLLKGMFFVCMIPLLPFIILGWVLEKMGDK